MLRKTLIVLLVLTLAAPQGALATWDDVIDFADDIDDFEKDLRKWGQIVVKKPDVWGQARFTAHRVEFEKIMADEADDFTLKLQGAISRADSAFAAQAMSISAALPGPQAHVIQPYEMMRRTLELGQQSADKITPGSTTLNIPLGAGAAGEGEEGGEGGSISRTQPGLPVLVPQLPKRDAIDIPDQIAAADLIYGQDSAIARTDQLRFTPLTFGAEGGLGLEPTIVLDQHARYLNHLHALRRINEGDDNADAPGYSMHLMRIPVSIQPSKKTAKGYGAQVSLALELQEDKHLLKRTFRDLVMNDVLNQLSPSIYQLLGRPDLIDQYRTLNKVTVEDEREAFRNDLYEDLFDELRNVDMSTVTLGRDSFSQFPFPPSDNDEVFNSLNLLNIARHLQDGFQHARIPNHKPQLKDVQAALRQELEAAFNFLEMNHDLKRPAPDAARTDTRNFWGLCSRELWVQVRSLLTQEEVGSLSGRVQQAQISRSRRIFEEMFDDELIVSSIQSTLVWAVLLDSALLNERLIQDMQDLDAIDSEFNPDFETIDPSGWPRFFLPSPEDNTDAAKNYFKACNDLFSEYVQHRWPPYVFALDPMTEDQNLIDQYSQRREMQIAMAVSLASGWFKSQSVRRYARRLETDMQTVALNRTITGFALGDEVFGWRFFPRFQTPPNESNIAAFGRQIFVGPRSPESNMRTWALDEGPRECVAIVVMPSFVQRVRVDIRSEWFPIGKRKFAQNIVKGDIFRWQGPKLKKAMRYSKTLNEILYNSTPANPPRSVGSTGTRYRQKDIDWLARYAKEERLEEKLPIRTASVNVPYENTLGGFQMFSGGATALGPELYGWYGGRGVDTGGTTNLFLIGDNFNTLTTKVIVGGKPVTSTLLSRQVLEVAIPKGVNPSADPKNPTVDVRVATPYGVTQTLAIPAFTSPKKKSMSDPIKSGYTWDSKPQGALHVEFVRRSANPAKAGTVDPGKIGFAAGTLAEVNVKRPAKGDLPAVSMTISGKVFAVDAAKKTTELGNLGDAGNPPVNIKFALGAKSAKLDSTNLTNLGKAIEKVVEKKLLRHHQAIVIHVNGDLKPATVGSKTIKTDTALIIVLVDDTP
jgi:hypothetical protein